MKKQEYLKHALKANKFEYKSWLVTAFTVCRPKTIKNPTPWDLEVTPRGYSVYTSNMELVPIEDATTNEPLFSFKQPVTIDESWLPIAKGQIETTVGNLLVNDLCIYKSFGESIPYLTGPISVGRVETIIEGKLQDTVEPEDRQPGGIYVDQYIAFVDSLVVLEDISHICVPAASRKTITAPPGIKQKKQELIQQYGDKLHDPVELTKFEEELLKYDAEYLKDDPSMGILLKGKILGTARKKLYLAVGAEKGFDEDLTVNPILNSFQEGWPSDSDQFVAMNNNSRSGSYSRGKETVKGGVSAKTLLRAGNSFRIKDGDCGTKLGHRLTYNKSDIHKLVGRYVITNTQGEYVAIENLQDASNYLGKPVIVRSPMYCHEQGDTICEVCAGKRLAPYKTGMAIPLTEISSIILTTSLKAMHGTKLSIVALNIQEAFS